MNDTEKAIEVLKEQIIKNAKILEALPNNARDRAVDLRDIIKACQLAISALEEKLNGGWIPVSERLPSEEECNKFDVTHPNARKFLCTIKVANYEPQVRTIYFSEIVGWKYSAQDYNEYVLAWQPLPKPYKEVEQ